MQISPKCCIVSVSLSAAAFALKCKAAQFYVSTRKHLQKQRPKAATYLCRFAAKARFDNRHPPRVGVSKEGGPQPSLFGRSRMGDFQGGRKIETSFPLEWRFWLLLSLLTKVTRRRQKERNSKSKSRIFNRFLGTFFRERIIPPEANKRIFSAPGRGTPVPHAK